MALFEASPLPLSPSSFGGGLGCNYAYYPARLVGGKRSPSSLKWIVIHSTESASARGSAEYFQSPTSGGSTNLLVGEDGCYRSVDDLRIPAGAPGANEKGLHVEVAGYAKWTRDQWYQNAPGALDKLVAVLSHWSDAYGIPLRHVDAEGLRRGDMGVTTHADVTRAFSGGAGHTDPGKGFPLDDVLERARGGVVLGAAIVVGVAYGLWRYTR